jgi:solute:Na+ symporter, SSS family
MNLPIVDVVVIAIYLLGTVAFGCWFVLRNRSPEAFTTAGGKAPAIVVGLSIFGTYVSNISFPALPGGRS